MKIIAQRYGDTFQSITHEEMQEMKRSANVFIETMRNRIDEYCRIAFESTLPHNWPLHKFLVEKDDNMNTTEMWISGREVLIGDYILGFRWKHTGEVIESPKTQVLALEQDPKNISALDQHKGIFYIGNDAEWHEANIKVSNVQRTQKTIDELVQEMLINQHRADALQQAAESQSADERRVLGVPSHVYGITDDHRKAWKARLAVKIAEAEEKERCRVLVDREYEDWE